MSKLPQDLRLIISQEVKDEWDLDHILDVFRSELEARERANGNNVSPIDQSSTKPPYNRGRKGLPLSTDAALFAERIMHLMPVRTWQALQREKRF